MPAASGSRRCAARSRRTTRPRSGSAPPTRPSTARAACRGCRTAGWCATRSRPIPRPSWEPLTCGASAPIRRCSSSCSTPASACPVHFHPGREFAARELGLGHGKTEAWLIVEADPGAAVHVGFARDVGLDEVRGWMAAQDSGAMLDAMQELPVTGGDAVFVPAGAPHAIGAGILMVEVQEPTDLSVLLEWEGFELTEDEGHLDLGWDTALRALDRSVLGRAARGRAARPGCGPLAAAGRRRPVVPGRAGARRRRARRGLLDPRRALRRRRARRRAVRRAGPPCWCRPKRVR